MNLLTILYIKLGTGDLAKYPFLNEASDYIRETRFDFEEFNRPEMKHIINRAAERIETELINGIIYQKLDKYEVEILTFLVMLMMAKSIGIGIILKKHSLFEAMRAERFLSEDLKKEKSEQKKKRLRKVHQNKTRKHPIPFLLRINNGNNKNEYNIKYFLNPE